MSADRLGDLVADITTCRRCPRLVAWREEVARTKVARHRDSVYWGRPVPGFGDPEARLLVLGLAPAAHGANRSGRVFTGDNPGGSGEILYAALHRAGYAPAARSVGPADGLCLRDCYIAAVNRCAPPANKPTTEERDNCLPFLVRELRLLARARVILVLGGYAWAAVLRALADEGHEASPRPRFGHGSEARVGPYTLLGCYHPSQQNTFTGRLTTDMLDGVLGRSRALTEAVSGTGRSSAVAVGPGRGGSNASA
ncbi:MAG: uracil-DNA glycosylase [Candidatus Limnocylindrales bacterium]